MTRRSFLFLSAMRLAAQIAQPRIGYVVDRTGKLRSVHGVAGAFALGTPEDDEVISAAYSGKSLLVKKDARLIVDGESLDAPAGPARVSFDSAGIAVEVYFPDSGAVWTRQNGKLQESHSAPSMPSAIIRDGDIEIDGVPMRLRSQAVQVSQLGDGWLVVYAKDCNYAIRGASIYELPEDGV